MILYASANSLDASTTSLFPTEQGGGVEFSNEEICSQSDIYALLYLYLIDNISPILGNALSVPVKSARVLVRNGIVPLAHVFFDRLLRLQLIQFSNPNLSIARAAPIATPEGPENLFSLAATSPAFNQDVLVRAGALWNLKVVSTSVAIPLYEDRGTSPSGYRNHLFDFPGLTRRKRVWHRLKLMVSRHTGGVIATWMINSRVPSLEAGLYGWKKFAHMQDQWNFQSNSSPSSELRDRVIRRPILDVSAGIVEFARTLGVEWSSGGDVLGRSFADFCGAYFPLALLESASENLRIGIAELDRFKRCRSVYSSGISLTTQSAFLIAAARARGMVLVGSQHGGHCGYLDKHVLANETEYADCDEYVTWGWGPMSEHPALDHVKAVPLPSPWLNTRVMQWRRALEGNMHFSSPKSFDFVLMPNKIYRFPPAPSGAHASGNSLAAIAALLLDVVRQASDQGYRVLLKPFSAELETQMPATISRMKELAGEKFVLSANLDKGLTRELILQSHIFLWDQPGSGFLECLASGIPTMVIWPRLYNREAKCAVNIFTELEAAGIVHRDMKCLLESFADFRHEPARWMLDARRSDIVRRFVTEYGRIDSGWKREWLEFIKAHR